MCLFVFLDVMYLYILHVFVQYIKVLVTLHEYNDMYYSLILHHIHFFNSTNLICVGILNFFMICTYKYQILTNLILNLAKLYKSLLYKIVVFLIKLMFP